jgi:hypothetical protein
LVAAKVDGGVDHQFGGLIDGFAVLAPFVFKRVLLAGSC